MKKITKKITSKISDIRIDLFLTENLNINRSLVQKNILNNNVLVNNNLVKKNYLLKENDEISLVDFVIDDTQEVKAIDEDLLVLYEDDYLLVVYKESNLVMYPGSGKETRSLLGILLSKYENKLSTINPERPGIVHRLDKETDGVVIICKDNKTHEAISKMFKERKITKTYYGIVKGKLIRQSGEISTPIAKSKRNPIKQVVSTLGKESLTKYEVLSYSNNMSLVKVNLVTGRTHQIRVHFSSIGSPLFGDTLYGGGKSGKFYLTAKAISFIHPITKKEINVECELSNNFQNIIKDFTKY